MAAPYYQQNQPGWGTNQFQFGPPPAPNFQPQPSWGGMDFYRAHAPSPDPSLFDNAWNRVRDYSSGTRGGVGVGLHEARHWHRRAYGGQGELNMMLPTEIGHAAAYEAYRTWIHNSSMREPLSGDNERQREGLIGLAVAEATRLLQFSGRSMDGYSRKTASEAAAHTASSIFFQSREGMDDEYRSRGRSQTYDDPYAFDDALAYPRARSQSRHHNRSHGRSHSRHRSYSHLPPPMNIPGTAYSNPGPYSGGSPGQYEGNMGSYGSYSGGGMPMSMSGHTSSGYGPPMGGGVPYPPISPYHGMPPGVTSSHQGGVPMVVPMGSRSRTNSMSYPPPYMGSAVSAGSMGMPVVAMPPAQTIVIHRPHRKHKHRHQSRSRRSRSTDPDYGGYSSSSRY